MDVVVFNVIDSIWRAHQNNSNSNANSWWSNEVRGKDSDMSRVQDSTAVK
jgi:hypothetical protein